MLNLLKGQILGKMRRRHHLIHKNWVSYHQFVNDGLVILDRRALKCDHGVFALRRDAISVDRKRFVLGVCAHKDTRVSEIAHACPGAQVLVSEYPC